MRPVSKGVATLLIPQIHGLKGPKGDTGERGTSGPQGPRGESVVGSPGTTNYNELENKPTLFSGVYADLSGKPSLFSGAYADLSGKPTLGTLAAQSGTFSGMSSGTNTGDNATNTQYSGLAASKQDTLISATNIKTINGSSVMGAGDLVVSGSVAITQTEVDFGSTPVSEALFTIADATATATSKIIGSVAYAAPTGKDLDELEMDSLELKFGPKGAGEFYIYAKGLDGYVHDKFKVNYQIAA